MPSLRELQRSSPPRCSIATRGDAAASASPSIATRCSPTTATRSAPPIRSCGDWSARRSSTRRSTPSCAAHPSTGGDLNVYGERFGDFLAALPARARAAVPARRRAARMGGRRGEPRRGRRRHARGACSRRWPAVPADRITRPALRRRPVVPLRRLRISGPADLAGASAFVHRRHQRRSSARSTDQLLVRREDGAVVVERLAPGDFALSAGA